MKNKDKLVRIDMLREGMKFEIPSLCETMRNMKLISVSDCSSLIEGQKRDFGDEPWKPFRFHISNSVLVQPVGEFTENKIMNNTNQNTEPVVSKEKKGRGRPKKNRMEFAKLHGVSSDFTVKDVASANNLENYEVQSMIKEAMGAGMIKNVGELKNRRGKPQKIYRLV